MEMRKFRIAVFLGTLLVLLALAVVLTLRDNGCFETLCFVTEGRGSSFGMERHTDMGDLAREHMVRHGEGVFR